METFPKIVQVIALPKKVLRVVFDNGKTKAYDCSPLLQRPAFFLLKDDGLFKSVKVDAGGYGVSWNDNIDISEYELWSNGIETNVPELIST